MEQGNACRAVRIVFNGCNFRRYADLISSKVNQAIKPLMSTSTKADSYPAIIIATPSLLRRSQKTLLRDRLGYFLEGRDTHLPETGRCRFKVANCHEYPSLE